MVKIVVTIRIWNKTVRMINLIGLGLFSCDRTLGRF